MDIKGNKRLPDETFEEFRSRRALENQWIKEHLKGAEVWPAMSRKPYINPVKELERRLEVAENAVG